MRVFITDCEGPIAKNDNAMELAAHFIPEGGRFFAIVSRYDDYLADVQKRPGYKAGDTLRLITPFLKAFGAIDAGVEAFSRSHILLMPGAEQTLHLVQEVMPAFIISTSYEPYIKALCDAIHFPFAQTYSTHLSLDRHPLSKEEEAYLRSAAEEIAQMPMLEWSESGELMEGCRHVLERLEQIFWEDIAGMQIGRLLSEVDPIGGEAKGEAVRAIVARTAVETRDVIYIGDSITDVQAMEVVRKGGGLAISFNGNSYAISSAQVATLARDTGIITILAYLFALGGKDLVLATLPHWGVDTLRKAGVSEEIISYFTPDAEVGEITAENQGIWIEKSQRLRKEVRGVAIGSLG